MHESPSSSSPAASPAVSPAATKKDIKKLEKLERQLMEQREKAERQRQKDARKAEAKAAHLAPAARTDNVSMFSDHGSYSSAAAASNAVLGKFPWYVGRASRMDAEQMLSMVRGACGLIDAHSTQSDEGTILVRDSGPDHALSVKWTQCGGGHWCTHVKITCHPQLLFQICAAGGPPRRTAAANLRQTRSSPLRRSSTSTWRTATCLRSASGRMRACRRRH